MRLGAIPFALIDRPGQAMRTVASRPRSWWLPALLLLVTLVTYSLVTADAALTLANERVAMALERAAASAQSEVQAEQIRAQAVEMTMPAYLASTIGGGLVMAGLGWLVRGSLAHLGALLMGGASKWSAAFATALWSMLPFAARDLLLTATYLVGGRLVEQMGLSFLVASGDVIADSRNVLYALLSNVDPFALWHLVLLAIAIPAATKLGHGRGVVLAVLIWVIITGLKLLPTVVSGALLG